MSKKQQFAPWMIVEKLNQGGDGLCYKVIREEGQYYHVLKIPVCDYAKQSILREIDVLSEVDHPNIVSLVDSCSDPAEPWLVTRYHRRGTLENLKCSRWEPGDVSRFYQQISDTLAWLHSKGIAHGNLTHPNILLTQRSKRPVFIDFARSRYEGDKDFEKIRAVDLYELGILYNYIFNRWMRQLSVEAISYSFVNRPSEQPRLAAE